MSGFRKHATRGAVAVSALGLAGDEQADLTVLGGLAKAVYRGTFRPSSRLARPHVMLALNVVAADSEIEARRLFTSQQLGFINLRRGRPGLVQPPVEDITAVSTPEERAGVDRALACAAGLGHRRRSGVTSRRLLRGTGRMSECFGGSSLANGYSPEENSGVRGLIGWLSAFLAGSAGWWLGAKVGLGAAVVLGAVAGGAGLYAGHRWFDTNLK
jgi:hypothetical protein